MGENYLETGIRYKLLKGATLVSCSEAIVYGASFLRNVILARILTKADFGIGAILFLVLGLFELTAKTGISRFVVQDKEGNEPNFIASAHLMQAVAGVVAALLIICSTPVLSNIFNIGDKWWALVILALVPLLRGLEHIDIRRYERFLRFGPSSTVEIVPQIIITILAWPIAIWLGDFKAILILIIAKSAISCIISHLYSNYSYRWKYHKEYIVRMWKFGWPLILTSFLIFGIMQGDQFMVATFYNMSELASYAIAVSLVTAISFIIGRIVSSVGLPILSEVQDNPSIFESRYRKMLSILVLLSSATGVPMIIGSESLIKLFFGYKYSGAGIIMAWLSAAYAFRNLRVAPTLAALAKGDSVNQLIANIWRAMAIAPMVVIAYFNLDIWILAACGLIGEAGACYVSLVRLRRRDGIPIRVSMGPIFLLGFFLLMAGIVASMGIYKLSVSWGILVALIGFIFSVVLSVVIFSDLRNELYAMMKQEGSYNLIKFLIWQK